MTEERATYDAGTPGPIDPRDARAVTLAYADGMQAAYDSGERDIVQMRYAGLQAVARAVCPETYMVVNMAEIERIRDHCNCRTTYQALNKIIMNEHDPELDDKHHAVFDTRTHVCVPVTFVPEPTSFYSHTPDRRTT